MVFKISSGLNLLRVYNDGRRPSKDKYVILSLYVDNILLVGNDQEFFFAIKKSLSSNFEMKGMGEAAYILSVKIERDRSKKLLLPKRLTREKFLNDSICKVVTP